MFGTMHYGIVLTVSHTMADLICQDGLRRRTAIYKRAPANNVICYNIKPGLLTSARLIRRVRLGGERVNNHSRSY